MKRSPDSPTACLRRSAYGDGAWADTPAKDKEIVTAMRKGQKLTIKGASWRGTETLDGYSLKGIVQALAKIDSIEAAELLVGVIENDGRDERAAVVDSLRRARGTKFIEVARAQFPRMNPPAQAAVRELLQARGVAIG